MGLDSRKKKASRSGGQDQGRGEDSEEGVEKGRNIQNTLGEILKDLSIQSTRTSLTIISTSQTPCKIETVLHTIWFRFESSGGHGKVVIWN